ncbi:hypothetical protein E2C01_041768 [Portunus trituberculatus]|uniref:Uncharacterized protein n=1 Tax=Portunus trituberculatus TaxID=210409 RepID=A0A5B7FUL4_PORTR|nr:hypothetical protein [Portunus trituberculatus]
MEALGNAEGALGEGRMRSGGRERNGRVEGRHPLTITVEASGMNRTSQQCAAADHITRRELCPTYPKNE